MAAFNGGYNLYAPNGASVEALAHVRKMLGQLHEGRVQISQLYRTLGDGTVIIAQRVGSMYRASVESPQSEPVNGLGSNVWWPRGFVVYPAWHDKPLGVGLPVVQEGVDPFSKTNLAPGLDPSRWTPAGACGEVLLTRDSNAGYPVRGTIDAPYLYDPSNGVAVRSVDGATFDNRAFTTPWSAYRLEFEAPLSLAGENAAASVATFDALNAARSGAGWPAAFREFRGYARTAALTASLMQNRHDLNPTSPASYGDYSVRLTKDGYSASAVLQVPGTSHALDPTLYTRAYVPWAWEFLGTGSGAGTVHAWQTQVGSHLLDDMGPCAVADVAVNGGYAALSLESRDRWIHAGNAYWQSVHKDIPPLSWHGFASMNLAWETFPCNMNYAGTPSASLDYAFDFLYPVGDIWLKYRRNTLDEFTPPETTNSEVYYEPAMSRHLYIRGRSIAMAPKGGLFWGACVQQNTAKIDRLIALVHHAEDQPGYVPGFTPGVPTNSDTTNGYTRYLRVWWCDVPRRANGVRMSPEETICGIDTHDKWAWQGGTLIDVGVMPAVSEFSPGSGPNSLKYASVWRFSADGKKAVCLRDYGARSDYNALGQAAPYWTAGLPPRAIELTFTLFGIAAGPTTVDVQFHDFAGGPYNGARPVHHPENPDLDGITPFDDDETFLAGGLWETGVIPIAVDYDADGNLIYAFSGSLLSIAYVHTPPPSGPLTLTGEYQTWTQGAGATTPTNPLTTQIANEIHYVGTGDASTRYISDLKNRVLHGSVLRTNKINRGPGIALVLDIQSATFALKVTKPRFFTDLAGATGPNYPPLLNLSPDYQSTTCSGNTSSGVMLARKGEVVFTDWYTAANDTLFEEPFDVCRNANTDPSVTWLPRAASATVQGYYVQRFGETIYGYQVSPMPMATPYITAAPTSECGCGYTVTGLAASALMPIASLAPRGGRAVSTIPLPSNDWLIFAKVV